MPWVRLGVQSGACGSTRIRTCCEAFVPDETRADTRRHEAEEIQSQWILLPAWRNSRQNLK